MTDHKRRHLLIGLAAAAGAAVAVPWVWRRWPRRAPAPADTHAHTSEMHAPFQQPLRIPGREGLLADVALTAPLTLRAQSTALPVFAGKATPVWHYAGTVAGQKIANPLLRVRRGDRIDVQFDNGLDEASTIHWHGITVDEANDGSGLHPIAPGASTHYHFEVHNRAGLYWYHAHPHMRTGLQLQRGLAGLLLVEDDEERALREQLALPWGERDLPLMLADKQVDADNAIVYKLGADDWIGNRVLVNWTPEPYLDVKRGLYRLRLANVANARMWRLAFVHDDQVLPFQLIGTDGGLLAQPWQVEDLFLAPAQRADVLVDFSDVPAGARVRLRSLEYVAMENEDESGGALVADPMADHPGATPMGMPQDLMEFRVGDALVASPSVPAQLAQYAPLPDTKNWPVRPLRLRMDNAGTWFINDWNFHQAGHDPVFTVQRGSREVWEIRNNMTSMPHPIHLHGFQFRLLSRSISPPDVSARAVAAGGLGPQDLGWTDTVVVWPGEIVRIAIDFAQPFKGLQRYMLHCHNLEHEDMGMMVTFAVDD